MKLLYCHNCGDVFSLSSYWKYCMCGKTRGKYTEDGNKAVFEGDEAFPLGFDNHTLRSALRKRLDLYESPIGRYGFHFDAFVYSQANSVFLKGNGD